MSGCAATTPSKNEKKKKKKKKRQTCPQKMTKNESLLPKKDKK